MPAIGDEVREAILEAEKAAGSGDFGARADALELLLVHAIDRLRYLGQGTGLAPDLQTLEAAATALGQRLERANERALQRLRQRIASGRTTPAGLKRALSRYARPPGASDRDGYDTLDLLVGGLLGDGPPVAEQAVREPEMVFYQPTPARAILALIDRASIGRDDTLVDLGSGLGHVVILVALLSGARGIGIEFEPAYCEYAARCARSLNVPGVAFLHADARHAPLGDGTVFFLYTPFRGAMLQEVLRRLRAEANDRPIRVCTYGPCTLDVARATWLRPAGAVVGEHEVAVFQPCERRGGSTPGGRPT